jgi:hypothetical protein
MKPMKAKSNPVLPFTIVRDSNETAKYHFAGIQSDVGDKCDGLPWIVPLIEKPLYSMHRLPISVDRKPEIIKGLADYSIDGMEHQVQIERKSVPDLFSTLGGRRHEFECEIARLNMLAFSAVVIEGNWKSIVLDPPPESQLFVKTVSRTILSWSIRYPRVHWFTCEGRRHAELTTFNLLRQFYKQFK